MNLRLSDGQQMLVDAVERLFRQRSTPAHIRAAEPLGFDGGLWDLVQGLGLPHLRAPQEQGGSGAGLMDAVLVAEQCGRHLASVPLLEAIVCARLAAELQAAGVALELSGNAVATIAVDDIESRPRQVVPGAAIADLVIGRMGRSIVVIRDFEFDGELADLGSTPARMVDLAGSPKLVVSSEERLLLLFDSCVEELRLLYAAYTAAGAQRCLEIASEYARERQAFGKPIGSYQGLAHPLADAAVEVDGARLLAWRAVDLLARGHRDASAAMAMATWWAPLAAARAVIQATRTFGGYGMSLEYDAQLYLRRVIAGGITVGSPAHRLQEVTHRLWAGAATNMPDAGDCPLTFDWDAQAAAVGERMRSFCAARDDEDMRRFQFGSEDLVHPTLYKEMATEGLLYPDWPVEWGGGGLRADDAAAAEAAMGEFGWYALPRVTTDMVGKMIMQYGSVQAREDILPRLARAEGFASLGYSEPGCGSDVFAARTRAVRDGERWIVNGQKMFTSQGHFADYCLLIARTGEDKYKGLTLFVVPVRQPGYSFSEIKTIGGERTNITYFENVIVPDVYRLGEINGGVKLLAAALTLEQSGELYCNFLRGLLDNGVEYARQLGIPLVDPAWSALAELATKLTVQEVLTRRASWASSQDSRAKWHGPMAKLFGTESLVSSSLALLQAFGADCAMRTYSAQGHVERDFRRSLASTIYAGTSEVQRSLIAESALGLPRSR